jgi:hypothetical protein
MTICTLRHARIVLLTLTLGLVFAGLTLAQGAPMSADRPPGKSCAPAMSLAASQPDLNPLGLTPPEPTPNSCHYFGLFDEWRKDGEVCRTRNTCLPPGQQISGSCPNGFDEHTSEVVVCFC